MRSLTALAGAAFLILAVPQIADTQTAVNGAPNAMSVSITSPGDQAVSRRVALGVNKSMIVELDRPAADVVISNPEIADAVVQTSQRIIFRGIEFGQTNALIFDRAGKVLLDLNIHVETDMAALQETVSRHVPDARVELESLNGSVIMTGNVDNLAQADQIARLVAAFFPAGEQAPQLVNMLNIAAADQVMLEVRIIEMQRSVIKQLGINLTGSIGFGDLASDALQQVLPDGVSPFSQSINAGTSTGFNVQGQPLGGFAGTTSYRNFVGNQLQSSVGASINAMERIGIVRTLAEPNIVAMSGESAKFLAGGEFPVPVGQSDTGEIRIEFKPYGVGLSFTPVVLSEGRISLKVSTEVSELTAQGAFQGASRTVIGPDGQPFTVQGITLPALTVRRAESVVELPSGGSMMMAGLISVKDRQTIDQLPGLKKLPILGSLFQSRDFLTDETELVIIVTPYLVGPAGKSELRTPADGYANASDAKTIFFGRLNETYGRDGAPIPPDEYRAPVGFMEE